MALNSIALSAFGSGANSVAISNGLIVVVVEADIQLSETSEGSDTLLSLSGSEEVLMTLRGVTVNLADLNVQAYLSV